MSFQTSDRITKRLDGTFVVQHETRPYHVVPRTMDPHGALDFDEVDSFATAHPGMVDVEIPPNELDALRVALKRQIDLSIPTLRKAGFDYQGTLYQADPGVTEALNGILVALGAGVPVAFPIRWRSGDNARPSWENSTEFASFAAAVLGFVDGLYQQAFDNKDAIDVAETIEAAQQVFDSGPWSKGAQ